MTGPYAPVADPAIVQDDPVPAILGDIDALSELLGMFG